MTTCVKLYIVLPQAFYPNFTPASNFYPNSTPIRHQILLDFIGFYHFFGAIFEVKISQKVRFFGTFLRKTGPAGFEPTNAGVKVLCLTAWRWAKGLWCPKSRYFQASKSKLKPCTNLRYFDFYPNFTPANTDDSIPFRHFSPLIRTSSSHRRGRLSSRAHINPLSNLMMHVP